MSTYLEKASLYPTLVYEAPHSALSMIVVIPCFNEPDLLATLKSLHTANKIKTAIEVLVIINEPEHATEEAKKRNIITFKEATNWCREKNTPAFKYHIIKLKPLSARHAGVGLARKVGMDEAVSRFENLSNKDGVIIALDGDCTVSPDYFEELNDFFYRHPDCDCCNIFFEHRMDTLNFSQMNAAQEYELHLRYYVNAQYQAGFPYAIQTVGSSMAVRSRAYQAKGGMNRRKAGEDFYFLHKFSSGYFGFLNTTTVYPSSRVSDRVPFGTGKAIGDLLISNQELETYHPDCFKDLKQFFDLIPGIYQSEYDETVVPVSIKCFLKENNFQVILKEIKSNVKSEMAFIKRFFGWFNAFRVMKYVHYCTPQFYLKIPITKAARNLLELLGYKNPPISVDQLLKIFRDLDRKRGSM